MGSILLIFFFNTLFAFRHRPWVSSVGLKESLLLVIAVDIWVLWVYCCVSWDNDGAIHEWSDLPVSHVNMDALLLLNLRVCYNGDRTVSGEWSLEPKDTWILIMYFGDHRYLIRLAWLQFGWDVDYLIVGISADPLNVADLCWSFDGLVDDHGHDGGIYGVFLGSSTRWFRSCYRSLKMHKRMLKIPPRYWLWPCP